MDKNAIKKYAVWARRELITRVSGRAAQYGVTEDGWGDANADSVNGLVLSDTEKRQRSAFIKKVKSEGYKQAVEEVAYTWFNRFCALRYMEVNGYLPSHVRVFTNEAGEFKPEIIDEALHLDIDGLDMDKVLSLKEDAQKTEELFRYLLITQCNALNSILPGTFQKIEDYTELLLPENLLREGSVIEQMIAQIPEEDWTDQVQIIGWLYQYYNIEPNELVYDGNMSKSRIPKELLPAATTIYTPDWVVRYMVENSLGRLWIEGHPDKDADKLKSNWKYFLEEAEQESEVEAQLAEIRKDYANLKPEDIKCIDPCCGSGHILCYMFDVLIQIYESYGYTVQEAVSSIVENNLYGLDIDERAAQLAYFAVMMKARSYDRRFFSRGIQPHVYAICESNEMDQNVINYFVGNDPELKKDFGTLVEEFQDAKEYGSILNISQMNFCNMYERVEELKHDISLYSPLVTEQILPLIQVGQTLAQKYDVVVTNPPYLGSSRFSPALDKYVKENYPDDKSDLSMVMLKKAMQGFSKKDGFISFITTSSWMSLSSLEKTRKYMFSKLAVSSLVDFGTELFEGKVGHNPIVSWVNRNSSLDYNLTAIRLVDYCYSHRDEKESEFFDERNIYTAKQSNFSRIPGFPIAYWASDNFIKAFLYGQKIEDIVLGAASGHKTANNDKFIRNWYEISQPNTKWALVSKGGDYRKWYGNWMYVLDWSVSARQFYLKNQTSNLMKDELCFREGITWSDISSRAFSCRYMRQDATCETVGPCLIIENKHERNYLMGLLNSKYAAFLFSLFNPGMHFKFSDIYRIPVLFDDNYNRVCDLTEENINISRNDWDSFEISFEFSCHPLIRPTLTLAEAYFAWENECNVRFYQLKSNEEELNRIFINMYGLQDELTPEEDDKDVTVRKADLQRDVKSLISYAVGCMFGRYSLDVDGLAYAGGEWDASKYKTYQPDYNGILPICDDEYFTDDIVGHFVDFIRTVYGEDTLEENLQFIADALGGSGSSREVIRKYFLNNFYVNHCKIYQKRPIYWLFDSGKKNGFKCLIYMHRYRPDTIARIRTDYVHEQQARYRTAIADVEKRVTDASTSERIKLNKQLKKLQDQSDELLGYEEKIHHLADQFIDIDLDDGVKANYAKFQDVLAKIK